MRPRNARPDDRLWRNSLIFPSPCESIDFALLNPPTSHIPGASDSPGIDSHLAARNVGLPLYDAGHNPAARQNDTQNEERQGDCDGIPNRVAAQPVFQANHEEQSDAYGVDGRRHKLAPDGVFVGFAEKVLSISLRMAVR